MERREQRQGGAAITVPFALRVAESVARVSGNQGNSQRWIDALGFKLSSEPKTWRHDLHLSISSSTPIIGRAVFSWCFCVHRTFPVNIHS